MADFNNEQWQASRLPQSLRMSPEFTLSSNHTLLVLLGTINQAEAVGLEPTRHISARWFSRPVPRPAGPLPYTYFISP